jgi:hypothetical protein
VTEQTKAVLAVAVFLLVWGSAVVLAMHSPLP